MANEEGLNKGMQDQIIINKNLREEGVEGKVEEVEINKGIKDLRINRDVLKENKGKVNNKIPSVVEVDLK